MARRSKEQIRIDNATDAAFKKHGSDKQFNIFDLSKIHEAGQTGNTA